jgi:hypothetical protein
MKRKLLISLCLDEETHATLLATATQRGLLHRRGPKAGKQGCIGALLAQLAEELRGQTNADSTDSSLSEENKLAQCQLRRSYREITNL